MESQGDRKSVRVTIYNQPYNLGVAGEPGEVEALAHSVDMLMTNIAQRAGNVDGMKVAVLACLQLSDQVRGLQQEIAALKNMEQELATLKSVEQELATLKGSHQQLAELKARVDSKTREFSLLLDGALK
jgi:cell division protein ZapA (FtsZ GTPase activity inhibitor)